jgi:hypothetical protein
VRAARAAGTAAFRRGGAQLLQPLDLRLAHGGVVDLEDLDRRLLFEPVLVDADDGLLAGVDLGLAAGGGLLDAELGHAGLDGLGHAAELLDLLDDARRPCGRVRA